MSTVDALRAIVKRLGNLRVTSLETECFYSILSDLEWEASGKRRVRGWGVREADNALEPLVKAGLLERRRVRGKYVTKTHYSLTQAGKAAL